MKDRENNLIKDNFDTNLPMLSIFPDSWKKVFDRYDNVTFDNLDHFIYTVKKLTQIEDNKCGMSYEKALDKLIKKESDFPDDEKHTIRDLVRNNLFMRGLITEEVYENYKYTSDGTQIDVDVGKYVSGDPACVLSPAKEYVDYFYELYVNISYAYYIDNKTVRENVAKLLATIEELERQHIFIKVNIVFADSNVCREEVRNFFSCIPLFSYKDAKTVDTMSAVINDRLLRKFYFAILEELYGSDLSSNYGTVTELKNTVNIGHEIKEVDLFTKIQKESGALNGN